MLFASPRLLQFFQDELGYPEELLDQIREDFFDAFLMILELEVNTYLDKNNLTEEYDRLFEIQKNDDFLESNLMTKFIEYYMENKDISSAVNKKMSYFTQMFVSNIKRRMTKEQLEGMDRIIDSDIEKYQKAQKLLQQEI